jgi:hypothetical protein
VHRAQIPSLLFSSLLLPFLLSQRELRTGKRKTGDTTEGTIGTAVFAYNRAALQQREGGFGCMLCVFMLCVYMCLCTVCVCVACVCVVPCVHDLCVLSPSRPAGLLPFLSCSILFAVFSDEKYRISTGALSPAGGISRSWTGCRENNQSYCLPLLPHSLQTSATAALTGKTRESIGN